MKKTFILIPAIAVGMMACNGGEKKADAMDSTATTTTTTTTEAPKAETAAPPMDSAAKMKAWMDYMTPGEMHKLMASWDGKWTEETTMWEAEGKEPSHGKASCENRMILGGRYQESHHKGDMMGMPFEGRSTLAYDNNKKMFISTWMDNMGTGVMVLEGTYDAANKTMSMKGKCVSPEDGKDMVVREEYKIIHDKHQVMEMYMTPAGGKEMKSMEIKMTKM